MRGNKFAKPAAHRAAGFPFSPSSDKHKNNLGIFSGKIWIYRLSINLVARFFQGLENQIIF